MAEIDEDKLDPLEPEHSPFERKEQAERRQDVKARMRELILEGYDTRAVNAECAKYWPEIARSTLRKYQLHVRRKMAITASDNKRQQSGNRGVTKERLQYLYYRAIQAGKLGVALDCLKQMMKLDGLDKPAPKTVTKNTLMIPGEAMQKLTNQQLKRIAAGDQQVITEAQEAEIIDAEVEDGSL